MLIKYILKVVFVLVLVHLIWYVELTIFIVENKIQ